VAGFGEEFSPFGVRDEVCGFKLEVSERDIAFKGVVYYFVLELACVTEVEDFKLGDYCKYFDVIRCLEVCEVIRRGDEVIVVLLTATIEKF
jgi:hypothetical protein